MASLYIKDPETAALVDRVAKRSGISKTAAVRQAMIAREAELDRDQAAHRPADPIAWLEDFWRKHGIEPRDPSLPELSTDKAFFDELSGDL